jgi:hypothetical protein
LSAAATTSLVVDGRADSRPLRSGLCGSAVHGRVVDQGAESGQKRVESDFELVVAANLREDVGVLNQ